MLPPTGKSPDRYSFSLAAVCGRRVALANQIARITTGVVSIGIHDGFILMLLASVARIERRFLPAALDPSEISLCPSYRLHFVSSLPAMAG
jgi:hypothetical protein